MSKKKRIVVLTGAGISAESGLQTFRGSGGMWNDYDVSVVASIDGWYENPALVQEFYNKRRAELANAEPNTAHKILAELENDFEVRVITQNVDNLHEKAGSSHVLHLHGELTKACSSANHEEVIEIGYRPIEHGEKSADGSLLRPFIVWFGEAVPMIEPAAELMKTADILLIVGTSLNVYPAAGLVHYTRRDIPIYLIDPNEVATTNEGRITFIKEKATVGMEKVRELLLESK